MAANDAELRWLLRQALMGWRMAADCTCSTAGKCEVCEEIAEIEQAAGL